MLIRQKVAAGTLIATIISTMLIGIFVLGGATAQAAPPGTLGTLTLTPATGLDITAPAVRTSAGCAADSNGYNVVVTGPGPFAAGFFIVGTTSANFSTTDPIDSAFSLNMRDAAAQLGTTIVPAEYIVTFNCVDDFIGDVKGTFVGSMYFTSPTTYQTTDPNGPPTATTSANPTTSTTATTSATTTSTVTTSTTTTSTSATSSTGTPITTTPTTTPPMSNPATTTTPGSGCELPQSFEWVTGPAPFLPEDVLDVELFLADLEAFLSDLEAFTACIAGQGSLGECAAPTAIDLDPFRDGEIEDLDAFLAEVNSFFVDLDAFLDCVGPDVGGSSTTTTPTDIAGMNPPANSGGGTQTIGMTSGPLGQTGGPVQLIFIGGLILVAVGLVLIIVVGRLRKGLE